jgi:hypothetical protein
LKAKKPKPLAEVFHGELWGSRENKNSALWMGSPASLIRTLLIEKPPAYTFVERDYEVEEAYLTGFSVPELLPVNSVGIVTARDKLTIDIDREALWARVEDFARTDPETLRTRYNLRNDVQNWTVADARADVIDHIDRSRLTRIAYRPFDNRWTFYTGKSSGFICRPLKNVMRHFLIGENLAIEVSRQKKSPGNYSNILVHGIISESSLISNRTAEIGSTFPLYLYPDEQELDQSIRINFDSKLYAQIREAAGLTGPPVAPDGTDAFRKAAGDARPDEVKVFDYIYGVLHCPAYRETYAEFLKIDFPRVPFPPSPDVFRKVSEQGEALRRLHLMEDAVIGETPYPFHGDGDSVVDKPRYESGRVWINGMGDEGQYFDNVPAVSWTFPIGGYQPAQKWLKDRKGRTLTYDDIRHYQKIIKILAETDRIMREIDMPLD